jgi:hypothetical protein
MLVILKKTYTIEVTIQEGSDEFWDSFRTKSGADDVLAMVKEALAEKNISALVRLTRFEERGPMAIPLPYEEEADL